MKFLSALRLLSIVSIGSLALGLPSLSSAQAAVLIGNTGNNTIVEVDETDGRFLGEFVSPFAGLKVQIP
jgi:hypothetical protein